MLGFSRFIIQLIFANRILDRIGNSWGPVIAALGDSLGMHVTLVIGGPEPSKNGQINVISYVV